jgi:hypothetical protein
VLDLTIVWQRYIRSQAALQTMRECRDGSYRQPFVSATMMAGHQAMAAVRLRNRHGE